MESRSPLGIVLVTGGCGRLGSKLVKVLLAEPTCSDVHVVSRNPTTNLQDTVSYHAGDLINSAQMTTLLDKIKPSVIFHVASPRYLAPDSEQWKTNVVGTRILLQCAAACPSVKALVYTSSQFVVIPAAPGILQTEETAKLWNEHSKINMYSKTKAICDTEVRAANNPSSLLTTVLRIPSFYGPENDNLVAELLENLKKGQHNVQIGDNVLKYEFLYEVKAVEAHILAAKALLSELGSTSIKGKVGGEAFFISDGVSMPFFDFARKIYSLAGKPVATEEIKVMPLWFMLPLASCLEWMYWIFTLGAKQPELRRWDMEFFMTSVAWRIDKARKVLGYEPVVDQNEVLKMCVERCMDNSKR